MPQELVERFWFIRAKTSPNTQRDAQKISEQIIFKTRPRLKFPN